MAKDTQDPIQALRRRVFELETQLKETEDRSELFYRCFLHSNDAIEITDRQGRLIYVNPSFERIYGYTAEELLGENPRIVKSGKTSPDVFRAMWQSLVDEKKGYWSGEIVNRDKSGREHPVILTVSAIRDAEGRIGRFMGLAVDITERKEAEEALRRSEEHYRDLIENSPEIIFLLSPEGIFQHVNRTGLQRLGYLLEELVEKSLLEVTAEGSRHAVERHLREVFRRSQGFVEAVLLTKPEEPVYVSISTTAQRDDSGSVVAMRAFVRDITERRRLEQQVFRSERLASIGQLTAGITHEIGTPLNVISGTAEYLLMDPQSQSLRSELQVIIEQADRITALLNELLTFVRSRPSRNEILDVNLLLNKTVALVRRQVSKSRVKVQKRFQEPLPKVFGDPDQLEQVFLNMIINAWHSMETGGGTLTLATLGPVSWTDSQGMRKGVKIVIQDTGCGIPEQHLETIFDPFFTTKDPGKGTGLGLSIAQQIVSRHQGRIEVESRLNHGSAFQVYLPLPEEQGN